MSNHDIKFKLQLHIASCPNSHVLNIVLLTGELMNLLSILHDVCNNDLAILCSIVTKHC